MNPNGYLAALQKVAAQKDAHPEANHIHPLDVDKSDIHGGMKLQRGDILLMSPEKPKTDTSLMGRATDLFEKGYGAVAGKIEGRYTHATMYGGKGRLLDLYAPVLKSKSLARVSKGKSFMVIRPKVTPAQREAATSFVEKNLGKITYNYSDLLPAGASLVAPSVFGGARTLSKAEIEKKKSFICSGLVASAYEHAGVRLARDMPSDTATPLDLLSDKRKVKIIGQHIAPGDEGKSPLPTWGRLSHLNKLYADHNLL